ncbi:hypothetical protein NLJ89_g9779 [Agrocybe chaxingu]|uniref:Uncharacterized protein n=1 Tax=Agrocybe chaxingu TaxID=84603 RepID=A0A9W8JSD8_9AGAR|nr:hypothetical protein NLJ89_g9779 [Agrocybe chaxingu]
MAEERKRRGHREPPGVLEPRLVDDAGLLPYPEDSPRAGFQLPKFWSWFARVIGDTRLLLDPVAPQLICTGLDVLGLDAKDVWGQQWLKVLGLLYEGITTGYEPGKLIGG